MATKDKTYSKLFTIVFFFIYLAFNKLGAPYELGDWIYLMYLKNKTKKDLTPMLFSS